MNMSDNKRRQNRFESFLIVEFRSSRKHRDYLIGMTRDLSCEGFSMESQCFEHAKGEVLDIRLKHTQCDIVVNVPGEVIWKKQAWYKYIVGIKFREVDEDVRSKFKQLISLITSGPDTPLPFCEGDKSTSQRDGKDSTGSGETGIIDGMFVGASDMRNRDETAPSVNDRELHSLDNQEHEPDKEVRTGDRRNAEDPPDVVESPAPEKEINVAALYLAGSSDGRWKKKLWYIIPLITMLAVMMFIALPSMMKKFHEAPYATEDALHSAVDKVSDPSIIDTAQGSTNELAGNIRGQDTGPGSDEDIIPGEPLVNSAITGQSERQSVSDALRDDESEGKDNFSTAKIDDKVEDAGPGTKKPSLKDVIARIDSTLNDIHGSAPQGGGEHKMGPLEVLGLDESSPGHAEEKSPASAQEHVYSRGVLDELEEQNRGKPGEIDSADKHDENLNNGPDHGIDRDMRADPPEQEISVKGDSGVTTSSMLYRKDEQMTPENSKLKKSGLVIPKNMKLAGPAAPEDNPPETALLIPERGPVNTKEKRIALLVPPKSATAKQEQKEDRIALLVPPKSSAVKQEQKTGKTDPQGEPSKKVEVKGIALVIPPQNAGMKKEKKAGPAATPEEPSKAQSSKIALLIAPLGSSATQVTESSNAGRHRKWRNIGTVSGLSLFIDSGHIVNKAESVFEFYMRTSVEDTQFNDLIEINCKLSKLRLMEKNVSSNPALSPYSDEWSAITPENMVLFNSICL